MARLHEMNCDICPHQGKREECNSSECTFGPAYRVEDLGNGLRVTWHEDFDTIILDEEELVELLEAIRKAKK